ncbi:unnamed protein product [Amaranthus hypochondriacus]
MDNLKNLSSNYANEIIYESWETIIRVCNEEDYELKTELRKGPWTSDEDAKLTSSIAIHGEGRWDCLANLAGLKRSGKSCRLRWLNYLRPNLRRGTFTLEEQLLILELHFRWGNRWSKIAESLPGRTDNEIKNYWRTKVQKLARQFRCNVNSPEFRDALRKIWIPRLVEQIQANSISNHKEAQNEGPTYDCGLALHHNIHTSNNNINNNSENYCFVDGPTFWASTCLDQPVVGPNYVSSQPIITYDEAHISPESNSSAELDPNWEEIHEILMDSVNDVDYMWFWQPQID